MTVKDLDIIWNRVVIPEFKKLSAKFPGLFLYKNSKEDFFEEYDILRLHCKHNYMKNQDKLVDRHKVSAAMMIAILKTEPIKLSEELYKTDSKIKWLFNERLAISVGMSVLVAFIKKTNSQDSELLEKFKNGIVYPEANHGKYINNFATELYYTKKENSYNLLALANELFLLERLTIYST